MVFSDEVYNKLKWVAQYLLPAIGTLYFALSGIWNLPYGEQIVGTITAIDTFLGVLLGISSKNYKGDGTMNVSTGEAEKDVYSLELNGPVEDLANKKVITFKVNGSK